MSPRLRSRSLVLFVAGFAAFSTYFCMYAFRKPFTAATFADQFVFDFGLKAALVIAQLIGYMLSKFIGIRLISSMRPERRAAALVGLILVAEAALVGFAYAPVPVKVLMMFVNGLPLGMVFGLVLGYLEGREQTEALTAALCASFIVSSGVTKSVGQWLLQAGIDEFQMPMIAGLLFFPPLLVSVWMLQATPKPSEADRRERRDRRAMDGEQRRRFVGAYWPGLTLLVLVYVALTVLRTVRDDFGVELWHGLGEETRPEVFTQTETIVALFVTALNGIAIMIHNNLTALRATVGMMCGAFLLTLASALMLSAGQLTPFVFMVACGVGLYIPYVAFHTTLFERLIAASRHPCNLGFLMYLADAVGYLGYAVVICVQMSVGASANVLPFFHGALLVVGAISIVALLAAIAFFERALMRESDAVMPAPEVVQ